MSPLDNNSQILSALKDVETATSKLAHAQKSIVNASNDLSIYMNHLNQNPFYIFDFLHLLCKREECSFNEDKDFERATDLRHMLNGLQARIVNYTNAIKILSVRIQGWDTVLSVLTSELTSKPLNIKAQKSCDERQVKSFEEEKGAYEFLLEISETCKLGQLHHFREKIEKFPLLQRGHAIMRLVQLNILNAMKVHDFQDCAAICGYFLSYQKPSNNPNCEHTFELMNTFLREHATSQVLDAIVDSLSFLQQAHKCLKHAPKYKRNLDLLFTGLHENVKCGIERQIVASRKEFLNQNEELDFQKYCKYHDLSVEVKASYIAILFGVIAATQEINLKRFSLSAGGWGMPHGARYTSA